MPQAKRASKAKRFPSKAVSVLGIAGASWAASTGGSPADMGAVSFAAPTAGSAPDIVWRNASPFQASTLDEEEITDVSLATFHVYDDENLGTPRLGIRLARGCAACNACGACRGCGGWSGCFSDGQPSQNQKPIFGGDN